MRDLILGKQQLIAKLKMQGTRRASKTQGSEKTQRSAKTRCLKRRAVICALICALEQALRSLIRWIDSLAVQLLRSQGADR
jgi:hypothetical protein